MSSNTFFIMAKPDALKRGLLGKIISRFEKRGFVLEKIKIVDGEILEDIIKVHYLEHVGKTFYNSLIEFGCSGPVCAMIWKGNVQVARSLIGSTLPWEAKPGTIRGDYASSLPNNLVHCSDSIESAEREVEIWKNLANL
jgi:nucleoside-diphosphate kinase